MSTTEVVNSQPRRRRRAREGNLPHAVRHRDDLGETQDLAAAQPDKVKELQALWNIWNTANVKPLWGGGKADNDGPDPGAPAKKGKQGKETKWTR